MAKQKVTEKILADAKKEVGEILNEYRAQASEIKKIQDEKITIQKSQIERDSEASKKIEYLRRVSQKKLELNRNFVAERRKLIDSVIDEALKELPKHKEYLNSAGEFDTYQVENCEEDTEPDSNELDLPQGNARTY